jgi:ferredoxin
MEFAKKGVVNAGLIFFALTLLSTLILGRWFCGWGCHVVLLQDACGWLMKRIGIRPRPFRSRLLVYVPLLLALYMFIWPAVHRFGWVPLDGWMERTLGLDHWLLVGQRAVAAFLDIPLNEAVLAPWKVDADLYTTDFWATFARWMAIPFLLVCGFASVYFLGAKGFCTYGCPYGGFFAPIDKLSPARIRVTDACEHCGHCTAVCTSNVRVHEEVREYGAVVDPGCMKCFDCVSVCPNDALYFGLGAPAIAKGRPRHAEPKPPHDLSWPGEIAAALVFAACFFIYRGLYGLVPMLMAAGMAGCMTYIIWKAWCVLVLPNANQHRFRLKFHGTISRSGWVFLALALVGVLFTVHSGIVRGVMVSARRLDDRVGISLDAVLAGETMGPETAAMADRAMARYRLGSAITDGGMALCSAFQPEIDMRSSWFQMAGGDLAGAEATLHRAIERDGRSERFCRNLMTVRSAREGATAAMEYAAPVLAEEEGFGQMLGEYVSLASENGAVDAALAVCRTRFERFPEDAPTLHWLPLLLLETGRAEEAVTVLRHRIGVNDEDLAAWQLLASIQYRLGLPEETLGTMNAAIESLPEEPALRRQLAELLDLLGRTLEADEQRSIAQRLQEGE